jgi:hypothetical protein
MSIKTIRNDLITHLASDGDIAALCMELFGNAPKFFNATDLADPPKDSDAPYIVVETGTRARDSGMHYYNHTLWVIVRVFDDAVDDDGGAVIFGGCNARDDLAALVERKTTLYLSGQGVSSRQVPDMDDVVTFPWFSAYWTYEIMVRDILG